MAPDGQGFAVWDGGGGGANREVRVAPVPGAVPVLGRAVAVQPASGKVFVSVSGGGAFASATVPGIKGRRFVALTAARQLPVGSIVDTRRGAVSLASASSRPGQLFRALSPQGSSKRCSRAPD